MRAYEIITELFDTTDGLNWESPTKAAFTVNGEQYRAYFKQDGGGGSHYEFTFAHETPDPSSESGLAGTFKNTGKMGAASPRVFGYAVKAVEEFLARKLPYSLGFSGMSEDGRDTLYTKMARVLAKRSAAIGYDISVQDRPHSMSGPRTDFTLKRSKELESRMSAEAKERLRVEKEKADADRAAAVAAYDDVDFDEIEQMLNDTRRS